MLKFEGNLSKMTVGMDRPVKYFWTLREALPEPLLLNPFLGQKIILEFKGKISCVACGREITQTFNEGYCFPCFKRLAACDSCVMSPELCHFDKGTCREPEWGLKHCMQPHYVYLAHAHGTDVKVGLTRVGQIPTRWIDQGASSATFLFKVQSRFQAGVMEVLFKEFLTDKTQWQKMLKNEIGKVDLAQERRTLLNQTEVQMDSFISQFGEESLEVFEDEKIHTFEYPVLEYPKKITSLNFQKNPKIEGTLLGLKGQYIMTDVGVLNIRKHTGHRVSLSL